MTKVVLASALARWLTASPTPRAEEVTCRVAGATVREVLDNVFAKYPTLRGYVVDEHGALRHHVVAYLNNEAVSDKETLATPVKAESELYLFQALSGG
jgi:molybdopterin converting factor small subunit